VRAGASVRLVGAVGHDPEGRAALGDLASEGVDTRWIARRPEAATGLAVVLVDPGGENQIAVAPGANGLLAAEWASARARQPPSAW